MWVYRMKGPKLETGGRSLWNGGRGCSSLCSFGGSSHARKGNSSPDSPAVEKEDTMDAVWWIVGLLLIWFLFFRNR